MHDFETWDGLRIAYREWDADAAGPPVVLHHGFIADGHVNWVAPGMVAALRAAGRHVVAIDARGHGASDKPHEPERYGVEAMVRDVQALFDHLGCPAYDLVGYSLGAVVALITTTIEPRVRRLVVGGVGSAIVELGGVDSRVLPPEAVVQALLADDVSRIEHPGAQAFRAFADAVGGDRVALAAQAKRTHGHRIALEHITVPTLVIAGEDDELASRPEVLVDAIAGAQLARVPGEHVSAPSAPRFHEAVVAFLAER